MNAPILRQREYGPQHTIGVTAPGGATTLSPGDNLPAIAAAGSDNQTFWLRKGIYPMTASINPRSGQTFIGEFGAVLDGSGWTSFTDTDGAFRGHNQDHDNVTIRNLIIRNMPNLGIQAYFNYNNGWIIEHNEICGCATGINLAQGFLVRHNYIHHNVGPSPYDVDPALRGGGYAGSGCLNSRIEHNEIAYNGTEQKITGYDAPGGTDVIFRQNYVHHNIGDGIWYDTVPNANALIEDNVCEDNGRNSISIEGCPGTVGGIIRNNIVRRSGDNGIIITNSEYFEVRGNTIIDSNRGLAVLVNFGSPGEPSTHNAFTANRIKVPLIPVPSLEGIGNTKAVSCSSVGAGDDTLYASNFQQNTFVDNIYTAPDTTSNWFWWFLETTLVASEPAPADKTFLTWQAITGIDDLSIGVG